MLGPIVSKLNQFRNQIYQFFHTRCDASFELVDALSSNTHARHVVELSLSPWYRRNYCSITRSLDEFYPDKSNQEITQNALTTIISAHCVSPGKRKYLLLGR